MPKSPQDIYARHLLSPHGYPLWTPEPSHQLLVYRQDGLRIGDVGVVVPENATGVPDSFEPIALSDMDIRTIVEAENPGRIIKNSSVKSVRILRQPADSSLMPQSPGIEYDFTLSSNEGALLILPEGAESHDLRNHHRFLETAMQHGVDWYRFVEERVGQIIGSDSLYLITGLHKAHSWSLAAFEKTSGSAEHSARFVTSQTGGDDGVTTYAWETTGDLDWRAGPKYKHQIPNQSMFIRGFKIKLRTGMFSARYITVKADTPSTRSNPARSVGAVEGSSLLAYVFGGLSAGRSTESFGNSTQNEVGVNPVLEDARNEIRNGGTLAAGEHVVVQRIPEVSQAFHPSDIINQYLLDKKPSMKIAITHDDDWIVLLKENLLQVEDLIQDGQLKTLVSEKYDIISKKDVVHLQSRSELAMSNAADVNATMEIQEWMSEDLDAMDVVHLQSRSELAMSNAADVNATMEIQEWMSKDLDAMDIDDILVGLSYNFNIIASQKGDDHQGKVSMPSSMPDVTDQSMGGTSSGPGVLATHDYLCQWDVHGISCSQLLTSFDELMAHLAYAHGTRGAANKLFICGWLKNGSRCNTTCRRSSFRRHIQTHIRILSVSCPECGRIFSRKDALQVHCKNKHSSVTMSLPIT